MRALLSYLYRVVMDDAVDGAGLTRKYALNKAKYNLAWLWRCIEIYS